MFELLFNLKRLLLNKIEIRISLWRHIRMKKMLESGKIVNIHGLNGEVKAAPWCDSPDFLCGFDILYCLLYPSDAADE